MLERSYLLIINNGKVETILNKGLDERTNLKSLKQESIRKYIGYGIVWIQVFDKKLELQDLSDLLWAAAGINRPESGKRTSPTAMNKQSWSMCIGQKVLAARTSN